MVDTRELAQALREVSEPGAVEAQRRRAQALMARATPAEVSQAEQMLIDGGMAPEELRAACDIHLGLLNRRNVPARDSLPAGHVLDTLYREHVEILGFLDKLDKLAARLGVTEAHDPASEDHTLLRHLAEHLVGAEKHHQREEDVLFPELEKRGVDGPPRIMRLEHGQFRPRKHRLLELAETVTQPVNAPMAPAEFAAWRQEVADLAGYIVFHLRDHIFKEDNILYPTALKMIEDAKVWAEMKRRCDGIGYCCFSPAA